MDVWGFNGSMPGPMIEVDQGDRVRIWVQNQLPEPTWIHWHGLEMPVSQDGVPGLAQDSSRPARRCYEFTLHQHGTFFYHAHVAMQDAMGMVGSSSSTPSGRTSRSATGISLLITQELQILPNATIPTARGWTSTSSHSTAVRPLTTPRGQAR